jgi:hypothetical protein
MRGSKMKSSSMRYQARKELVATLEQQAQQLQRDATGLQTQNDTLVLRQAFVHAWCEGMAAVRSCAAGPPAVPPSDDDDDDDVAAADDDEEEAGVVTDAHALQLQQLQDAEGSLLQQLRECHRPALSTAVPAAPHDVASTRGASGAASGRAPGSLTGGDCCAPNADADAAMMAPVSDPCAVFLRALSRPPPAEVYGMTLQRLGHFARDVTLEMSICLHQLEGSAAAGLNHSLAQEQRAAIFARLRQLWDM